ncbi:hypothetical protein C0993_004242 [Termitomyces sp. T159_Od127]|nr:hypothetical protein C0993_004242 [Termitomyces sp. T159_Od127]
MHSHLSFVDLGLLNPLPLVFSHRETLYEDDQGSGRALEKELEEEFYSFHNLESLDEAIEVRNQIDATTLHLLPSIEEIQASQTTSQQLAQVFATNSLPQVFQDVVLQYLHSFEYVFSKASFNSLLKHKQWDHAIELMLDSKPSSCKV